MKEYWDETHYLKNGKPFKSRGYVDFGHWDKVTKAKKEK